jgi:hypothetical protein
MNKSNQQEAQFAMIRSWQESGLNQKQFCTEQSISYPLFHYWYKRFRLVAGNHPKKNSPFVSFSGAVIFAVVGKSSKVNNCPEPPRLSVLANRHAH